MATRTERVTAARRHRFLEILTDTSSVAMAAREAGLSVAALYRLRDADAEFAGEWRRALEIGYELIEGALLGVARGATAEKDFDVGLAKHLLQQRDVRGGRAGSAASAGGGAPKAVALADVEAEVMRLLAAGDKAAQA